MNRDVLRRSYDRFAPRYDQIFRHQQRPKIEALRGALPERLPTPVVDLGAGTGLLRRLLGLPCVQVDLSVEMLRRADGARVQADLARLPFPDACFGVAFAVTSLIDFADPAPALAEIGRVVRPGGWLALSVLKIENVPAIEAALPGAGFEVRRTLDLVQDQGFVARRR